MSAQMPVPDALWPLLDAVCDDTLIETQSEELAAVLDSEAAVRKVFIDHIRLQTDIRFLCQTERACNIGLAAVRATFPKEETPPFPAILSTAIHGSMGYFSSGWPVAYLVATVVFGLGLLIGSLVRVPQSGQLVEQKQSVKHDGQTADPRMDFVGRITGMIDCQWADPNTSVPGPVAVPLGRKYALSSGLLEITYNTGAKVILQGPCTYEVESRVGGYLSVGKLTARVEKEVQSRESRVESTKQHPATLQSPIASPSLSTLDSPLFAIRTPTATVTDLGTEFGVEVSDDGRTTSHVFRGKVEVQLAARDGQQGKAIQLSENESAQVGRTSGGEELAVHRVAVDSAGFVRHEQLPKLAEESRLKPFRRWQAYSRQLRKDPTLVAYFTFEPHEEGNASTLRNQSPAGSALDGEIHNAEWVSGRFPGKLALLFHGAGSGDKVVLPEQERFTFTKPFSVAVWFRVGQFQDDYVPALVAKGGVTWRLERFGTTKSLTIDTVGDDVPFKLAPHTDVTDHRWHLVVAVIEPQATGHSKRLYLDGRLEAECDIPKVLAQSDEPVLIGMSTVRPDREFDGLIDEVAIFARQISPKEIETMFVAGSPADASPKDTSRDD